jgi:serine/threonine-protein kinase HipA
MIAREAYVHMHMDGQFVVAGRIRYYQDGRFSQCLFEYSNRYLERADAVAVDPISLPLQREHTYEGPLGGALFNGILDACPDDWGRHLLDIAAEGSGARLSDFDYMLYAGPDRIGALGFSSAPKVPPFTVTPPWGMNLPGADLKLQGMLMATDDVEQADQLEPQYRRFFVRGSSIGGARPKASFESEGKFWIAKFSKEREAWPTCRIEHATMALATLCGITVAATKRITVLGNRDILLVERFDRKRLADTVHRIPFVSAMTLIGAAKPDSPATYADIATSMRRDFYSAPATHHDMRELYRRMAFNALCNNSDDHLRNHGFLLQPASNGRSGWALSPAYGVVPQPVMDDSPRSLHLGIGPEGRKATLSNLLAAGRHFGIQSAEAQAIIDELKGTITQHWEDIFLDAGVPQSNLPDLRNCFALALRPDES